MYASRPVFVRRYQKKVLWVLVPPAGMQKNQGGTSVTEVLRDGGVTFGDCENPWRAFATDRVCTQSTASP